MSCVQITAHGPHLKVRNVSQPRCLTHSQLFLSPNFTVTSRRPTTNVSSYKRCNTVCLFGGERKAGNGDEASPWKSLEQAMQGFRKERSVQDVLREQMQKKEFSDEFGGGGGKPPDSGRGGGSDGSGGGSEDEGMAGVLDEVVQVVLATLGFMFLYYYILQGAEITRLAKDIIRYIFTKKQSVRLSRLSYQMQAFYRHLTRKEEVQQDWLERAIINTPTWWHNPARLKRVLHYCLSSGYYD
ncbi:hypothetical protein IFM89_004058 [Coptis chinensis]|uniref:Uncharacterized protein n=1 Tax=Coptis chinensis TaxID=261450 RepID=A0A835H6A3_9MAGN|nr:hypothetical protein IFM89_004058 [Coptis chinensis]